MTQENKPKRTHFITSIFKGRQNKEESNEQDSISTRTLINYFQSFVNNHPDIVLVLSMDGEVISENEYKINRLLGYRLKKKIDLLDHILQKDYEVLKSAIAQASEGISSQNELTVYDAKGQRKVLEITYIPIGLLNHAHAGIVLTIKDITVKKQLENSNRLQRKHLEQTQELSEIASWEYDIARDEFNCSDTFYTLTGLKPSKKVSEATLIAIFHQAEQSKVKQLLDHAITKGAGFLADCRIYHVITNKLLYVQMKVDIVYQGHQPSKLVGIIKDNTASYLAEKNLIDMYESYRHIFNHLSAGIWMRDAIERDLIFASEGLSDMFQLPLSTIYEQPEIMKEMVVEEDRTALFEKYRLLHAGLKVDHRYKIIDHKGNRKWIYEQAIPRKDENDNITHVFGMRLDITQEMESIQQLNFLAKHDRITQLPNQYSLYDQVTQYTEDDQLAEFALLYIDLNNYEVLSNYLGYRVIDKLLIRVTNELMTYVADKNYLAKVDNSAFILLVPNYKEKTFIFDLAERITDRLMELIQVDEYEIYLIVSIGISFYPENGHLALSLIENAYAALYHAKKITEKNYQIYSTEKDIQSHKKYILERDLRKAIQRNEFEMYYQAQVSPKTGKLVSVEALIRWNHSDWGVVSPREFIELAEEKHLIHHIGNWVIEAVCKQIRAWQDASLKVVPVAINISPIQILKTDFVQVIERMLLGYDIHPSMIEIEITESILLQDEQSIKEDLQGLQELGIKLALDDFGTGYSTFHYLQHFEIDKIKIDQSFIQHIMRDNSYETKEAAIVSSFLHLAQGLNITVVAEGVDSYEQLEFLRQQECDLVQGYIYSKPVEAKKFAMILQEGFLVAKKRKKFIKPVKERRKYFRYRFPDHVIAQMEIIEVNHRKVNMGSANILVENMSVGGVRILSTLRLPINKNIKLKFYITLMGIEYALVGRLVYINEEIDDIFSYGVSFSINEGEKNRLAQMINHLTVSKEIQTELRDTPVVKQNHYLYLKEHG